MVSFRRALRLSPGPAQLQAWTLLGHEYVELRNTGAAIEAYRRAADLNPRDYRPWHALGQAHELQGMHSYAVFYFRKAVAMRPYDSRFVTGLICSGHQGSLCANGCPYACRMWCALAQAYESSGRVADAIKCYERADNNTDLEGIATSKLAELYEADNKQEEAARCFKKVLDKHRQEMVRFRDWRVP